MTVPYLLPHLLARAAERDGGRTAVVDGERQVSYAALDAWANRVAAVLRDRGVSRGDRVGLYLDKSAEVVAGAHGIMRAGAAYVPFDASAPVARLGRVAADAGIRVLVTTGTTAEHWAGLRDAGAPIEHAVCLDGPPPAGGHPVAVAGAETVDAAPADPVDAGTIETDLAYVLYTSGSTGVPKGVMLTHRNALAFVDWAVDEFGVRPDDRLSSHAPLHFDLSVFDLYAAAAVGAPVVLVPRSSSVFPVETRRFLEREAITVWYSVPSVLTLLVLRGGLEPGALPSLRTVLFAGEVFPSKHLTRLMELVPDASFANLYGPTETNVCTFHRLEVPPGDADIPIGRAIANVDVFAVTDDGDLAADGEVGELWVRGPTVMKGYWGAPDRTDEVLVANPFDAFGDPVYCTGDLARRDEHGRWWFLGRRDAQIKTRGYRVELGEIETALTRQPVVAECAAVAVPDPEVTTRIVAHVVLEADADAGALLRHCRAELPHYMVPERVEIHDALPRTSNGKVDRQALRRLDELEGARL